MRLAIRTALVFPTINQQKFSRDRRQSRLPRRGVTRLDLSSGERSFSTVSTSAAWVYGFASIAVPRNACGSALRSYPVTNANGTPRLVKAAAITSDWPTS